MLEFLFKIEQLLKIWPDNTKWNMIQIAEKTGTPTPRVLEFLNEALNKPLDVHDPLSYNEVNKAYDIMCDRRCHEIETFRRKEQQAVARTITAYDQLMEKIRLLLAAKNYRNAYQTLTYFYGMHKERLTKDLTVALCNDCLRIGMREKINIQELSQWLKRGVEMLLRSPNRDAIEDALDFIETYGDYFLGGDERKGESLMTNLFLSLKPSAMEFDLTPKLNAVAGELNMTTVMDVTYQ